MIAPMRKNDWRFSISGTAWAGVRRLARQVRRAARAGIAA
jgi:hypothetical protein